MMKDLFVKGADEHNLKNIDVRIPRDKMVVLTGLSGSGKSSLAFDTIYAEGQRRYMESLSSYARQFLGQMEKPNVDYIEGLSPAISIDQKTTNRNPRSTVGTVTEIHDYLRLLFARIGTPHCPICGREITSQTVDQIVDILMEYPEGTKLTVLSPVVKQKKGMHEKVIDAIRREGFPRVRVDGEIRNLDEDEIKLEKTYKHTIEIVIDRIVIKPGVEGRLSESLESAVKHGEGLIVALVRQKGMDEEERVLSTKLACPEHGVSLGELEPRMFSFNNPYGACPECKGLGYLQQIDPELIITEKEKSIPQGALSKVFASMEFSGFYRQMIDALAKDHGVDIDTPWKDLPEKFRQEVLYGTGNRHLKYTYKSRSSGRESKMDHPFEGVLTNMERRYRETNSEYQKEKMESYMNLTPCEVCGGKRLRPEVLAVTVGGINIIELSDMAVHEGLKFINSIEMTEQQEAI